MVNPVGMLMRAKKGALSLDELNETLSALGIRAEFDDVEGGDSFEAFKALASAASLPSAKVVRMRLEIASGAAFEGLLVLRPSPVITKGT